MKNEYRILYKIAKNFEGMQKIEVFDVLHKMEVLLFYASSPVSKDNVRKILKSDIDNQSDIDPFYFTILPNGNLCEYIGSNNWLHIYQENNKFLPDWGLFRIYYFKTIHSPIQLKKLTKKNLQENVKGKYMEREVSNFLEKYTVTKRNRITNSLLLLEI